MSIPGFTSRAVAGRNKRSSKVQGHDTAAQVGTVKVNERSISNRARGTCFTFAHFCETSLLASLALEFSTPLTLLKIAATCKKDMTGHQASSSISRRISLTPAVEDTGTRCLAAPIWQKSTDLSRVMRRSPCTRSPNEDFG